MALTQNQLYKQQQRYGQASGIVAGVGNLLGQGLGMINEGKSINTNAPGQQLDPYGRPQFNLNQFQQEVNAIKPQGATGSEIFSGALQGAAGGAAFGPIGAGIGAAVGAGSSLIFGQRRKKLQQRKQRIAQGNLFAAQQLYNNSVQNFNNNQAAQSQYSDLMNMDNRMQNLFTFNNQ